MGLRPASGPHFMYETPSAPLEGSGFSRDSRDLGLPVEFERGKGVERVLKRMKVQHHCSRQVLSHCEIEKGAMKTGIVSC